MYFKNKMNFIQMQKKTIQMQMQTKLLENKCDI